MGELIEKIYARGAAVVGFDVVFPERENNSAQVVIDQLQQSSSSKGIDDKNSVELLEFLNKKKEAFDNNLKFAQSFEEKDVVLGFVLDYREGEPIGKLPPPP